MLEGCNLHINPYPILMPKTYKLRQVHLGRCARGCLKPDAIA